MVGQGLKPKGWDPMADVMSDDLLRARMNEIRAVIARSVDSMPDHMTFVADRVRQTQAA
jgi:tryptophan halogenase